MIIEQALLPVRPGQTEAFEAAFAEAGPIISAMPGFVALSLSRGVEEPAIYLLLVEWEQLADHTDGFRGSAGYQRWKQLLHHFYDPFPVVRHFDPVLSQRATGRQADGGYLPDDVLAATVRPAVTAREAKPQ